MTSVTLGLQKDRQSRSAYANVFCEQGVCYSVQSFAVWQAEKYALRQAFLNAHGKFSEVSLHPRCDGDLGKVDEKGGFLLERSADTAPGNGRIEALDSLATGCDLVLEVVQVQEGGRFEEDLVEL